SGGHRVQFRMTLQEETIRAAAEAEKTPDLLGVPARLNGVAEHHHIDRDLAEAADQRVLAADQQCTFVTLRPARLDHLGNLPTNDVGAFVQNACVELLVPFPEGPHINVKVVNLSLRA